MSSVAVKKRLRDQNLYPNEPEIQKFIRRISEWEFTFFETNAQKKKLNEWLDEMEFTYNSGMVECNMYAAYGGFALVRGVVDMGTNVNDFKELYRDRVLDLSRKDLAQARLLRNSLAFSLQDKYMDLYKQYDEFAKQAIGLTLKELQTEFMKKAIYQDAVFFIDSAGREWRPSTYANMYSRTRSREIEDILSADEMEEVGLDIVRINDVSTTTPICLKYEGKYFSRFGATPDLPVLDIYPPFHPNCRHRILAQREFRPTMTRVNKRIDNKFKLRSEDFTDSQKSQISRQTAWNKQNRQG